MIIQSQNLNEIRKQIQKLKKEKSDEQIIVRAGDEDFNRKILEIKGVNILLGPEFHERRDKLKQRDSGLNEFLCKLAKKNNIAIGVDIGPLKKLNKKQKARVLARIKQNIILCKRTKANIFLFPKEKYSCLDALSLFIALKGSTEQVKFK